MWLAGDQIKRRREAKGYAQDFVANALSVSKSYLSLLESGKRAPTQIQANSLAELLDLPADVLLITSGKIPSDIDEAVRNNATAVTTAVRSQADQAAVAFPQEPLDAPAGGKRTRSKQAAGRVPGLIEVTKTSTSYRAHSYHTKVPPAAIIPFIEAFTRPGDVILDSFCGSGMTGLAAASVGRSSLLSDLSPAAVHIATNYNTFCDPTAFEKAFRRVAGAVRPTMSWLYRPLGHSEETIEHTVWSDVFSCPHCGAEVLFWHHRGSSDEGVTCPQCEVTSSKAELVWLREQPVETRVSQNGKRMTSHSPTDAELALIEDVAEAPIPHWIPSIKFGSDREMWRASHGAMGISSAADFYTRRNLHALAALRHAIASEPDHRLRDALMFAFTASVNRASKRYQWNEKRPTNVMTGTLYISSVRYEWNVWSLFKRKAADVLRYYRSFVRNDTTSQVFQRSATDLSPIADSSVDMVFVDPPFGSNIFYADSSLLWDAWLGSATDQTQEIVVNQKRKSALGGKDIADYGALLTESFSELRRVLRPNGQAVVAFSNSNDRVWTSLQDAISDAGFDVRSVHILDKGQPSIKGVKGALGTEFVTRLDLAIALDRKTSIQRVVRASAGSDFIDASIKTSVAGGETRSDHLYANVLRDALQSNLKLIGITMPDIERRRLAMTSSKVDQSADRAVDLISGYLADLSLLATSNNPKSQTAAPTERFVKGSRGSPFYLAHSYHTKVPPEAIRPFILHFSKPGDVVLDPFCGSGMTGVASSMEGRKTILNDLSPAAVHLAWNHTRPIGPQVLTKAFDSIASNLQTQFDALYSTLDDRGRAANIRWTVWSTTHQCPVCSHQFALWDTMDKKSGRMGRATACPKCLHEADRRVFTVVANVPVWVAFQRSDGSLGEKAASPEDIERANSVEMPASLWRPSQPLGADREMYLRCALHLQGIRNVSDLYTRRNLKALALMWREIIAVPDQRVRNALAFAFTNTAWHGTRMRRFNARGGHRPMTGTLYVPQLSSEANVLEVMRHKIAQLETYYAAYQPTEETLPQITLGSATDLRGVKDGSVDYVFTDPPFGSNIFYADCNLVWESWLGRVTDVTLEAVVNRSLTITAGGKGLGEYAELMASSMREIVRVLKPGGWATIVFHNTDKEVWEAISDAATDAGLEFHQAASLDRQQQSHKGYKGRDGSEDVAHFDVVMNLRKPLGKPKAKRLKANSIDLAGLVHSALSVPEVAVKGLQGVHAEVLRRLASVGAGTFPDYSEVRAVYESVRSQK
ncbi:MAG: helix-turn-helix domain-containing protein [Devosia sp.]|uniref:DNA methyltransferase n=1 Tax=Devosia sp. TaxID=1871048 RepID=UPI001A36909C|nr:DNA methyltransferase [Devosia sp.]MBL8599933.1 helix-turn-helix domain-containing protein [Devosia sp.]